MNNTATVAAIIRHFNMIVWEQMYVLVWGEWREVDARDHRAYHAWACQLPALLAQYTGQVFVSKREGVFTDAFAGWLCEQVGRRAIECEALPDDIFVGPRDEHVFWWDRVAEWAYGMPQEAAMWRKMTARPCEVVELVAARLELAA